LHRRPRAFPQDRCSAHVPIVELDQAQTKAYAYPADAAPAAALQGVIGKGALYIRTDFHALHCIKRPRLCKTLPLAKISRILKKVMDTPTFCDKISNKVK
jgi:hypothetical protein